MTRFSLAQKRQEIEREIKMRKSVYGKMVHEKRMSPQEAADRIAIMEEILEHFVEIHEPRFPDSY